MTRSEEPSTEGDLGISASTPALLEEAELTRHLVNLGRSVRFDRLPSPVVERVKFCLLDWFAAAFAGTGTPVAQIIRSVALSGAGAGRAGVIGGDWREIGPVEAALVNGTCAHALDFDDGIESAEVVAGLAFHPSVSMISAALALAQSEEASGRQFIEAVVTAQETAVRVAALVGVPHARAGWHATGTVGTFGAVAAGSKILGLDERAWEMAIGIAGTQAAGLRAVFGTMSKPLHAGKAASNGVLAALLAREGFTSSADVLGARFGFVWGHSADPSPQAVRRPFGPPYAAEAVNFKLHASCGGTHCTIEAIRALLAEHRFSPEEVEEIVIRVPAPRLTSCNIESPQTALEGKFSLRYTGAAALLGWDTAGGCFTDVAVRSSEAVAIMERTAVEGTDRPSVAGPTEVEVLLRDGRRVSCRRDDEQRGGPKDWTGLSDKYRRLAVPVVGEAVAARLLELIDRLDALSTMRELHHVLQGEPIGAT